MKQYIDKDAVATEIKRRIILLENNSDGIISMLASGMFVNEYKDLLSFLDTLEVKEVGLDKHPSHTWIEKACKWLDENMEDHTRFYEYYDVHSAEPTDYDFKKDFVEAFKKAMEEQQ